MRFNFICTISALVSALSIPAYSQTQITEDVMPQSWQYNEGFTQTLPTNDKWWSGFGDNVLDSLITLGVNNNYDLLAATRRIEMARQSIIQTQSQYYPTVGASAGWNAQRMSGVTSSHSVDATSLNYFNLGVDMSWQIDVFGKIKERAAQSKAAYRATAAEYDAMMVTISGKIASAYMQLRTLQATLEVMQQHISQQKRVLDITMARHEAGLASMLDVSQAQTTYYSTLAGVTSINTQISTTINAIATLTATYPSEITAWLQAPAPLPDYKRMVSVGIPADLLRRRPDIVEAEYTLAQYAAALGVSKKDFLPSLSLNGQIGTSAHDITDMFSSRSFTYSIAPTISWTIFDGKARTAARESAKQQMLAGIDSYNATVLGAVQEVENAMASYYNSLKYIDMITQVTESSDKAFNLSIDLYKQGLTDFINVTQSQIAYLQYSNELVSAKGQALTALVSLYEALGGGF